MSAGVQDIISTVDVTTPSVTNSDTVLVFSVEKDKPPVKHRNNKNSFVRAGSFRNKQKLKQQDSTDGNMSSVSRGRSPGDNRLWRIRHFGHYDIQSVTVDRLSSQVAQGDPQQRLKKHTGASAAMLRVDDNGFDSEIQASNCFLDVGNDLVAVCPAFTNEIGNERDVHVTEDNIILKFRESLSQDKKMRLYSRERVVFDGYFVNDDCQTKPSDVFTVQSGSIFPLEYIDFGACYYRNHFYNKEHQNYVGFDDGLGPVVISLKREKISNQVIQFFSEGQPTNERTQSKYQYRIILRSSELPTLRGTLMEESIPSSIKSGSQKGIPPREVIEHITQGELQTSCLKLAKSDEKTTKELMRLDEQELNNRIKIGVLYCKAGQTNEEEWYNNENGSPAFDEFLELIGERVKMKGFTKYRAQLDNKTDTTGEYSIFTEFENSEIMFHVSTLLPFTPLLRKRHIGNDIVTLIFQEPDSKPFSPKTIRSHFQHIFIVVRVKNANTLMTEYQVAVSRSDDVPYFGPSIPENGIFQKSERFRSFLLSKLINASNAALQSDKLYAMAARTRKQYLSDLCKDSTTTITIDQAGGGALGRLFGRKRDRAGLISPLLFTPGAITWSVSIIMRHCKPLPFSEDNDFGLECTLCLSADVLTFIDATKVAILHIPTRDVCGYSLDKNRINLFYDQCYCISLECHDNEDDQQDLCKRLSVLTHAQEAILLEFGRSVISGLLGFTIDQDGTVVKVDGLAKMRGLQRGARVLQVEDKLICSNTPQEIADLLLDRNRATVKAFVIPPTPKMERPKLKRQPIDWEGVWSIRPQHTIDIESDCIEDKSLNFFNQPSPPLDNLSRRLSSDSVSPVKKRKNRPEQLQVIDPFQNDDIIYDRLISYNRGSISPSAKSTGSTGGPLSPSSSKSYSRMKVSQNKAVRQSVLQLANNIMDHYGDDGESNERYSWTPQPTDHHIEEYSPYVNTHITESTNIPDRKHTASPLSMIRKPVNPGALGERNFDHMPHLGQVNEMRKRFSQHSSLIQSAQRKSIHVPITVGQDQEPVMHPISHSEVHKQNVHRPTSWDSSESLDKTARKEFFWERRERGESVPLPDKPSDDALFQRNSNFRQPFKQKAISSNISPLKIYDDDSSSESNIIESIKHDLTPQLLSQFSGEDSPTKLLDEVLEQFETGDILQESSVTTRDTKMSALSVKARTQLWELKAHTQTLPRSFKARTKSQPSSPMKGVSDSPTTPVDNSINFNFNKSLKKETNDNKAVTYYRTRGPPISPSSSPKHRTLPFPPKPSSLTTKSHIHNGYNEEKNSHTKKSLITPLSNVNYLASPHSHSEKEFTFEREDALINQQLSWDTVMGDITSYCRSVAEWVRQTEEAAIEGENYDPQSPPSNDTISPTCSETFSLITPSVQSEPVMNNLQAKVELLEDKLEQESESNKELRLYLKRMEKQISELQNKQSSKILTKV